MTIDSMTLKALVEKGSDADFLREMIEVISNRLMQMEVESLTGAAHGERSASRINHRNGYRERAWETRVGTVDLAIPKLRKGSYFPAFLEPPRQREGRLHDRGRPTVPYPSRRALQRSLLRRAEPHCVHSNETESAGGAEA
jgi:transposase-like protein